jgi:diacylglycerol kinase (ATP)
MRLAIIANPVAGGGRSYKAIRRCAEQWSNPDWEIEILTTCDQNHAGLLARQLLARPPDILAVCGGDGTINEVASAVPDPPFPVAILPAGTANVLAREFGLPLHPVRALQIALKRNVRRVDLGVLKSDVTRRFLFVAGIGFDAYAAAWVPSGLKKKLGIAAYAIAIVECLRKYPFPEFQVILDGRGIAATSCLVCNARTYGGDLVFCPDADMSDGLLDILILRTRSRIGLACLLIRAWFHKPGTREWMHRLRGKNLRIEGSTEVLIQVDGELAGRIPADISLAPTRFPLITP